jgi:hypothetical protein
MRAGRLAASRSPGGAVYPSLTYRDVGAALTWLAEAFGFEGHVIEVSAIVRSGDGTALIQTDRPKDLHGSHTGHGWVYVVIGDIDAHYAREGRWRQPARRTPPLRQRLPRIQRPRPRRQPLELRHRPSSIARARAGRPGDAGSQIDLICMPRLKSAERHCSRRAAALRAGRAACDQSSARCGSRILIHNERRRPTSAIAA